jgi:hypothetical protein
MKRVTTGLFHKIASETNIFYKFSPNELSELQNCLFDIYLDVVRVCEKHNLYVLCWLEVLY